MCLCFECTDVSGICDCVLSAASRAALNSHSELRLMCVSPRLRLSVQPPLVGSFFSLLLPATRRRETSLFPFYVSTASRDNPVQRERVRSPGAASNDLGVEFHEASFQTLDPGLCMLKQTPGNTPSGTSCCSFWKASSSYDCYCYLLWVRSMHLHSD